MNDQARLNPNIRFTFGFGILKSMAAADGNPRDCPHGECRRRGTCSGGPRGTARRHGKPLCCTTEGMEAIARRLGERETRKRERELAARLDADFRSLHCGAWS